MTEPEIIIAVLDCLTRREAEAVLWVAQGKASWEAGRILGVAESTLDAHVKHAAEKLQASNRAHLVARAFVRGILVPAAKAVLCLVLSVVSIFGLSGQARAARVARCRRYEDVEAVQQAPGGA